MKLNVIREAEVETITKSIEGKVNEVKRTMTHPSDVTAMPHNSVPSDQDITPIGSEIFRVWHGVISCCDCCMISLYHIPLET